MQIKMGEKNQSMHKHARNKNLSWQTSVERDMALPDTNTKMRKIQQKYANHFVFILHRKGCRFYWFDKDKKLKRGYTQHILRTILIKKNTKIKN